MKRSGRPLDVDCQTCRESLSARMDGEPEPGPETWADDHLRTCSACRSWQTLASELTRALRVRSATATPDLVASVLAAAPPPRYRGLWPRVALGVVAVAQIALSLSQLLTMGSSADQPHGDVPMSGHLFNESTAWNFALGIGLLWAALRARAASGQLPALTGFVLVLSALSAHDLITGEVGVSRLATHALLVPGLVLLYAVHRRQHDRHGPVPSHSDALPEAESALSALFAGLPLTERDHHGTEPGRPPLRPASHHRAA